MVEVGGIGDERRDRAVPDVADHDAPLFAFLGCRVAERRSDIDGVVLADEYRTGLAELRRGGDEIAVLVEHLDALIAPVGDIDAVLRAAQENVVRLVEVAGRRS